MFWIFQRECWFKHDNHYFANKCGMLCALVLIVYNPLTIFLEVIGNDDDSVQARESVRGRERVNLIIIHNQHW